jgi:hypothetical protein
MPGTVHGSPVHLTQGTVSKEDRDNDTTVEELISFFVEDSKSLKWFDRRRRKHLLQGSIDITDSESLQGFRIRKTSGLQVVKAFGVRTGQGPVVEVNDIAY